LPLYVILFDFLTLIVFFKFHCCYFTLLSTRQTKLAVRQLFFARRMPWPDSHDILACLQWAQGRIQTNTVGLLWWFSVNGTVVFWRSHRLLHGSCVTHILGQRRGLGQSLLRDLGLSY